MIIQRKRLFLTCVKEVSKKKDNVGQYYEIRLLCSVETERKATRLKDRRKLDAVGSQ